MIAKSFPRRVFKEGVRDAITFGIAFVFLYLSIGILGATQALSWGQTLATLFIFSTPLQFLLVQHPNDGWLLIPVILVLNARFVLLSAAIAPHIRETSTAKITASLILITPSVFTAFVTRLKHRNDHSFTYMIGVGLPIFVVSIICTCIGFMAGEHLASPFVYAAMAMLLPLQFTALAGKHWPHYAELSSYWLGFIGAPLLVLIFKDYSLLLTPFVIGAAMVLVENRRKARETKAS
jgi:predicted branched-subunit amino acid permease